jgi:hypothetical protein
MAWGIASDWMGVGCTKPRDSTPLRRVGCNLRAEKAKMLVRCRGAQQAGRNIRHERLAQGLERVLALGYEGSR